MTEGLPVPVPMPGPYLRESDLHEAEQLAYIRMMTYWGIRIQGLRRGVQPPSLMMNSDLLQRAAAAMEEQEAEDDG